MESSCMEMVHQISTFHTNQTSTIQSPFTIYRLHCKPVIPLPAIKYEQVIMILFYGTFQSCFISILVHPQEKITACYVDPNLWHFSVALYKLFVFLDNQANDSCWLGIWLTWFVPLICSQYKPVKQLCNHPNEMHNMHSTNHSFHPLCQNSYWTKIITFGPQY